MPIKALKAFLLLLVFLIGCTKKDPAKEDPLVLVVNGDAYTSSQFAKQLARGLRHFDALAAKDPTNLEKLKQSVLRDFIISSLLQQFALKNNLTVSAAELDAEINSIRQGYPDDASFRESLISQNTTYEEWRKSIELRLLQKKAFQIISDSKKNFMPEARAYYSQHKEEFRAAPSIKIQQIVLAKEDDAELLLKKLRAGASFTALAKKHSVAPEAVDGGVVGYMQKGTLPVFDNVFNLKTGQISPVQKSPYGFHIIKILDKREGGAQSFDKVSAKIIKRLQSQYEQELFNKWLDKSINEAQIKKNTKVIEGIKIKTSGLVERESS